MANRSCCFCFRRENLTDILNAPEDYVAMISECFQIQLLSSDIQYSKHTYMMCKLCTEKLKSALSFRMEVQSCVICFQNVQNNASMSTNSNGNYDRKDFHEYLDMQVDDSDNDEAGDTSENSLQAIPKMEALITDKEKTNRRKSFGKRMEPDVVNIKNEEFTDNDPFDSTQVQYLTSHQGRKMLSYKGYLYRVGNILKDRIAWRCLREKYKCKGRCHVAQDVVVYETEHNHPPNTAKVEARCIMAKIKKAAETTDATADEIIMNTVPSLSMLGSSFLPQEGSIRRTIDRVRKRKLMNQTIGSSP